MLSGYEYRIERSKRKTVQLKICQDGTLLVKAPLHYPVQAIENWINSHTHWIDEHRSMMQKRVERERTYAQTPEQIDSLFRAAQAVIPQRVEYYSKSMGVVPMGIKITAAAKRFGSCSTRNTLCFSYRVMMYSPEAIDYVVVHELAHIRHHNHSSAFYALVESVLPDYKHREAMLKERI